MEPTPIAEPLPHVAEPPPDTEPELDWEERLRAFLHENLVLYNPLYLASAALVLGGLVALLFEPRLDGLAGELFISGLAELYAFALIGGAAILVRRGERRAAVMLGLLVMVFSCDVTLHVERSVFLGDAGLVAALAWVALFHAKVGLLARALELRLDRSSRWLPTLGALALVGLSRWAASDGSALALVVFGLVVVGLESPRIVESAVPFDVRGRRSLVAAWAILATGFALHVVEWAVETGLGLGSLVPMVVLLGVRSARVGELRAMATVALVIALVAAFDPELLSSVSLAGTVMLGLRALRKPVLRPGAVREPSPYRFGPDERIVARDHVERGLAPRMERERLLLAAAVSLHVAASSAVAGGLPIEHVIPLDLALIAASAFASVRARSVVRMIPGLVVGASLLVELGVASVPRAPGDIAAWALGGGFTLLALGLGVSLGAAKVQVLSSRPVRAAAPATPGLGTGN